MEKKSGRTGMSNDTKSIIAVLALLFAYPIGVIVMWFLPKWPKWVKFLITFPLILIPLLGIGATAVLVAVNPIAKIEKAQKAYCVKQCEDNASGSACINECVNKYKSNAIRKYQLSPVPTASIQY